MSLVPSRKSQNISTALSLHPCSMTDCTSCQDFRWTTRFTPCWRRMNSCSTSSNDLRGCMALSLCLSLTFFARYTSPIKATSTLTPRRCSSFSAKVAATSFGRADSTVVGRRSEVPAKGTTVRSIDSMNGERSNFSFFASNSTRLPANMTPIPCCALSRASSLGVGLAELRDVASLAAAGGDTSSTPDALGGSSSTSSVSASVAPTLEEDSRTAPSSHWTPTCAESLPHVDWRRVLAAEPRTRRTPPLADDRASRSWLVSSPTRRRW
mmetsp:Transcript_9938/g.27764  ORF Transcript_9938/g.27764 Transcript_9938/m.27764 type:complete len:267 (+) Transcript_9938:1235-2035(+)